MGLKLIDYKYCGLAVPDAYVRVEYPGSMKNPVIGVGYYASHEARQAGETALAFVQFAVPEPVPVNAPEVGEAQAAGVEIPPVEPVEPIPPVEPAPPVEPVEMTAGPETWFGEDVLKVEGMTASVASYEFLKTLPDFSDSTDV